MFAINPSRAVVPVTDRPNVYYVDANPDEISLPTDAQIQAVLDQYVEECGSLRRFPPEVQELLYYRDRGLCFSPFCLGLVMNGHPMGNGFYVDGMNDHYNITLAHYDPYHGLYDNVGYVRCLCRRCHIVEELLRGNEYGAQKQRRQRFNASGRHERKPSMKFLQSVAIARQKLNIHLPRNRDEELHMRRYFQKYVTNLRPVIEHYGFQ